MATFNTRRPAAQITGNAELRYFDAMGDYTNMFLRARDNLGDPTLPETKPYLGHTFGAFRRGNDQSHFVHDDLDGRARYMQICMFHALKHFNMGGWRMPVTLDRRYDAPDGSYADFWCSDGEIWTYRLAKDLPPIAQIGTVGPNGTGANTPHRTVIVGWSINGIPADFTDFHTVTATDVTSGHTAPEGKRVCRVFARDGQTFTWRDTILYAPTGFPYRFADEDRHPDPAVNADFEMNALVANVGQPATMAWMPVQSSLLQELPHTTDPVPDLFRARKTLLRSKQNNLLTGDDVFHFEITFRREKMAPRNGGILTANNFNIFCLGDGRVGIRLNGTLVVSTPIPDYTPFGRFETLQFVIDKSPGGLTQILDDAGNVIDSATTPDVNFFGRLRFFQDNDSDFFEGLVQSAILRIGSNSRAGTITHSLVGNSAASAGWWATGGVDFVGASNFELKNGDPLEPATL